ncbi:hypothetical protein [Arthrobacter sp. OAP107]|uniref:hypothetical protein n=1 Tax=Arthrobacter sp. OAP107 TaxID=3156445 RepID=UPI0033951B32
MHEVQSGAGGDERSHDPVRRQNIAAEVHMPAVPGVDRHADRLGMDSQQDVQIGIPRVLLFEIDQSCPAREKVLQLRQTTFLDVLVVQEQQPAFPAHVGRNAHRAGRFSEKVKTKAHAIGPVRVYMHTVAKKTVLKLMCVLGLACRGRRRKRHNSYQDEQGRSCPEPARPGVRRHRLEPEVCCAVLQDLSDHQGLSFSQHERPWFYRCGHS